MIALNGVVSNLEGPTKYGGAEILAEGLLALSKGKSGRLQLTVTDDDGQKHELGLYFDEDPQDGDGLIIRLQSR